MINQQALANASAALRAAADAIDTASTQAFSAQSALTPQQLADLPVGDMITGVAQAATDAAARASFYADALKVAATPAPPPKQTSGVVP